MQDAFGLLYIIYHLCFSAFLCNLKIEFNICKPPHGLIMCGVVRA